MVLSSDSPGGARPTLRLPALALLTEIAPIFAIAAALSYAVLRLAYVQFYSKLGVTPEAVGLGRTELVSQALVGPLFLVLIIFAFSVAIIGVYLVVVFVLYAVTVGILRARSEDWAGVKARVRRWPAWVRSFYGLLVSMIEDGHAGFLRTVRRRLAAMVLLAAACGVLVPTLLGFSQAEAKGDQVRLSGQPVAGVSIDLKLIEIPLLDIQALPVLVDWKDETSEPDVLKGGAGCLLYLGASGDRVVVFDVRDNSSIHFQAGDAVLRLTADRNAVTCH